MPLPAIEAYTSGDGKAVPEFVLDHPRISHTRVTCVLLRNAFRTLEAGPDHRQKH